MVFKELVVFFGDAFCEVLEPKENQGQTLASYMNTQLPQTGATRELDPGLKLAI